MFWIFHLTWLYWHATYSHTRTVHPELGGGRPANVRERECAIIVHHSLHVHTFCCCFFFQLNPNIFIKRQHHAMFFFSLSHLNPPCIDEYIVVCVCFYRSVYSIMLFTLYPFRCWNGWTKKKRNVWHHTQLFLFGGWSISWIDILAVSRLGCTAAVSYTHLTLPTKRIV